MKAITDMFAPKTPLAVLRSRLDSGVNDEDALRSEVPVKKVLMGRDPDETRGHLYFDPRGTDAQKISRILRSPFPIRERRATVVRWLETLAEAMVGIVGFAMKLAPYAVFCLIFSVVARFGLELLQKLAVYVGIVLAAYVALATVNATGARFTVVVNHLNSVGPGPRFAGAAVPEPASAEAILSGIIVLAGFAILRRRRERSYRQNR